MRGMEEVSEEEADELEEEGNEGIQTEDKERASWEVVNDHICTKVSAEGRVDSGLPIGRYRVGLCFSIRLKMVIAQ